MDNGNSNISVNEPHKERFLLQLTLADTMRLSLLGALITISKDITRIPLHMPGHSSLYWMAILVLGRSLINKFGAGIVMGIVSGTLAVMLGLGGQGFLVFFKYLAPGLALDLIMPLFGNKPQVPTVAVICGALASLAKMSVNLLLGILLNIPMAFLTVGLGFTSISHVIFGGLGGLMAVFLARQLKPRLSNWD